MNLLEQIKDHEGFSSTVYECTEGYDTIGYGFAIKDLELTEEIAEDILIGKLSKLRLRLCKTFDWFLDTPEVVQEVIMNMCYQMGLSGFSKFKKTIYYLETEQYEEAADEMLDSLWHKQTPGRSQELSDVIRGLV
jgi:lysozyme